LLLALQEGEAKVLFDRFISNKNGRHNHFPLSSLLDTTYGIILFDDQYTNVLEVCAGSDEYVIAKMRLAMRQGQKTELAELIHVFADGCKRNSDFWQDGNFAQALVRRIWFELIEQSPFLVNRQSVISRMQISWKLAWMKLQYPGLFEELRNGSGGESYGNN
jgi:DNA polymerase-3 subunit alpha